jgi:mRNA interferase MazF
MRGEIYRLTAPKDAQGHEQSGQRYAVVVQSDVLPLSTVLVAPTSTKARPASFRPEIEIDGTRTRILVEQIAAVDPERRLGRFAGVLTGDELHDVEQALADVLDLRTLG